MCRQELESSTHDDFGEITYHTCPWSLGNLHPLLPLPLQKDHSWKKTTVNKDHFYILLWMVFVNWFDWDIIFDLIIICKVHLSTKANFIFSIKHKVFIILLDCIVLFVSGLLYERFTVNCFNLMKNILLCDAYRTGKMDTG